MSSARTYLHEALAVILLAILIAGCATAAPQALSTQLEEHQRLANALHRRVRVHGGWAPEDYLGVVQTTPVLKGGFGGLDIWLRGDIVGTQCGQFVIASLLVLREHPLADPRTVNEEAIKNLVSVGWTAQAAEAARASCPGASTGGGAERAISSLYMAAPPQSGLLLGFTGFAPETIAPAVARLVASFGDIARRREIRLGSRARRSSEQG